MCKCSDIVSIVILLTVITGNKASIKEKCGRCVLSESCESYVRLSPEAQLTWRNRFICPPASNSDAKIDYVCCPKNVWEVSTTESTYQNDSKVNANAKLKSQDEQKKNIQPMRRNQRYEIRDIDESFKDSERVARSATRYENSRSNLRANYIAGQSSPPFNNPYFIPKSRNVFNAANTKQQCSITKMLPESSSGCCGLEATSNTEMQIDRATRSNSFANQRSLMRETGAQWPNFNSFFDGIRGFDRSKRDTAVNVTVGNRIAGGKETDLTAFPWTVLLKTIFAYDTRDVAFACGGSLISSQFVLTAGHCLFDVNGPVKQIEVNLAEYDKRTFPRDCKFVLSRGEVCVENIVMQADKYMLHPEYNDDQLLNDIALIRLRGNAPFTDYIRPICLPTVDVDTPELSNLRLAVAGWGRNGRFKSDVKQSTVVNLVPQQECRKSYPNLSRRQLCAAGYSGEDTCKGDSGGPLMLLYNGKYYISGVVSGKRADAPCGTSVPSLYTNVYQYVPWIRSVVNTN